jgi:hypothetical protein
MFFCLIRATFVKSFDKYWVKQSSPTLIVKRAVVSDGVNEDSTTTKKPTVSTTKKPAVQKSDDVSDDSTSTRVWDLTGNLNVWLAYRL